MWVQFVVSSLRVFSLGPLVIPHPSKTKISKFQFNQEFKGHKFVSLMTIRYHPCCSKPFFNRVLEHRYDIELLYQFLVSFAF